MLQTGAALIDSNEFIICLLNKFSLIKWARWVWSMLMYNSDVALPNDSTVAECVRAWDTLIDYVWSYGVREVMSSIPDRGNIVGRVFHPTRWPARFSLIWTCISFQILNLFRTLSSRGSGNYRPSAPLLYEVASHVKQLPFQPLLLFKSMGMILCQSISKWNIMKIIIFSFFT